MPNQLPTWIKGNQCFKPDTVICNLGYACDGCPYITDKKLLEIKQAEFAELEAEVAKSIKNYIKYTKEYNIEIPKEFNDWNLVEQSLYIFKHYKK